MEAITAAARPQQITSIRVRDLLEKAKKHMLEWNLQQGNEMPSGNRQKKPYKCTNINTGEVLIFDTEKAGLKHFNITTGLSSYIKKNMILRGEWKVA